MKCKVSADYDGLAEALKIIRGKLSEYHLDKREMEKSVLASEEVMHALLVHAEHEGEDSDERGHQVIKGRYRSGEGIANEKRLRCLFFVFFLQKNLDKTNTS